MNRIQFAKVAFGLSAILVSGSAFAQSADEVLKAKLPEISGDLAISENTTYNPALKSRYRELYYKLSKGVGEIERVAAIGASDVTDLEVFDNKSLKDLQKAGGLDDLKGAIHDQQAKIKRLMKAEKYGCDSLECFQLLTIFDEYCKKSAWADAYESWSALMRNYPASSKNIYLRGTNIILNKMKVAATGKEQQPWIDTLMIMWDNRMKYIMPTDRPQYGEAYCMGQKGVNLLKYRQNPIEEPYKLLMRSVELGSDDITVLQNAMKAMIAMFKDQKVDVNTVVDNYLKFTDRIDTKKKEYQKTIAEPANEKAKADAEKLLSDYSKGQAFIDQLFSTSDAAQCDILVNTFTARFKESPDDMELCDKIIKLLGSKGCSDSQLYEDVVSKVVEKNPTESSCAGFAKMLDKRGKQDDAIAYYEKAISMAEADTMKSAYNLAISVIYTTKKAYTSACSYARKAVALDPNNGAAYIIIATSYAAVPVGEDAYQRSLTYWVVIDKLQKAKAVDPSVAATANKLIAQYIGACPKKDEAFMHGVTAGTPVTVGGWIGESTTARF